MRYLKVEFVLVVTGLFVLGAAQACDEKAKPMEQAEVSATMVHMCRETPAANRLEVEQLARGGWRYAGPLHNDGVNCTVTLWTCNTGKCSARQDAAGTETEAP
jgi:hypothetical protein